MPPQPPPQPPRNWAFRLEDTSFTSSEQQWLWEAYLDLLDAGIAYDSSHPYRPYSVLHLGRKVPPLPGSDTHPDDFDAAAAAAASGLPRPTSGVLQLTAHDPVTARAAVLRFMATVDLVLRGVKSQLVSADMDAVPRVDSVAGMMDARAQMDGVSQQEVDEAVAVVRRRCGVSGADINPWRMGGMGSIMTIEAGWDPTWSVDRYGFDEYGYVFSLLVAPGGDGSSSGAGPPPTASSQAAPSGSSAGATSSSYTNIRPTSSSSGEELDPDAEEHTDAQFRGVSFSFPQLGFRMPLKPGQVLGVQAQFQLYAMADADGKLPKSVAEADSYEGPPPGQLLYAADQSTGRLRTPVMLTIWNHHGTVLALEREKKRKQRKKKKGPGLRAAIESIE